MTVRVLAGDVGGTKTTLGIYRAVGTEQLKLDREASFPSKQYQSLEAVLNEFLSSGQEDIDAAAFGIAGPVYENTVVPTNLAWGLVQASKLAQEIGCEQVCLMNDVEATAYGILFLPATELRTLNAGTPRNGNRAVIAAGTGLGQAILFWNGERFLPVSTEGGHADFAARTEIEVELLAFLRREFSRVSYERVLSGPGIYNIFRFLESRQPASPSVRERIRSEDPSAVITDAAIEGACSTCEQALEIFVSIYGAQAGNFALTSMAIGGVYIGGGIVTKILPKMTTGAFMEAFQAKEPFADLMAGIPVHVILNPKTCQLGAAHAAVDLTRGEGE
jgi:glucokinase